eukprot:g12890.t1
MKKDREKAKKVRFDLDLVDEFEDYKGSSDPPAPRCNPPPKQKSCLKRARQQNDSDNDARKQMAKAPARKKKKVGEVLLDHEEKAAARTRSREEESSSDEDDEQAIPCASSSSNSRNPFFHPKYRKGRLFFDALPPPLGAKVPQQWPQNWGWLADTIHIFGPAGLNHGETITTMTPRPLRKPRHFSDEDDSAEQEDLFASDVEDSSEDDFSSDDTGKSKQIRVTKFEYAADAIAAMLEHFAEVAEPWIAKRRIEDTMDVMYARDIVRRLV